MLSRNTWIASSGSARYASVLLLRGDIDLLEAASRGAFSVDGVPPDLLAESFHAEAAESLLLIGRTAGGKPMALSA